MIERGVELGLGETARDLPLVEYGLGETARDWPRLRTSSGGSNLLRTVPSCCGLILLSAGHSAWFQVALKASELLWVALNSTKWLSLTPSPSEQIRAALNICGCN